MVRRLHVDRAKLYEIRRRRRKGARKAGAKRYDSRVERIAVRAKRRRRGDDNVTRAIHYALMEKRAADKRRKAKKGARLVALRPAAQEGSSR